MLIILAAVTLNIVLDENGIINKAKEAKTKIEDASLEEKIKLLMAETMINQYTGEELELTAEKLQEELNKQDESVLVIQWDKYIIFDLDENKEYRVMNDGTTKYWGESTMGQTLLNTKTANTDQIVQDSSTSNIIGIDDQGKTVNMLLWEYKLIDNSSLGKVGTYGLNDENGLDASGISGRSAGYIGEYTQEGEIIGTMPAYISEDGGNSFTSVTSMVHTFYNCSNLIIAPEIADTIIDMQVAFYKSEQLNKAPTEIPNSVTQMGYSFQNCTKLQSVPNLGENIIDMSSAFAYTGITEFKKEIPKSVTNMRSTFAGCTLLVQGPETIPDNVINMQYTFTGCTSLEKAPKNISNQVTNMGSTFSDCTSLTKGPDVIPNSVTNMFRTFYNCHNLEGKLEIHANIGEDIVYEWNNIGYKGYDGTFSNAGKDGSGIIITKESTCRKEILNVWLTNNSNLNIEE